jgi:hypothetical protein
MCLYLRFNGFDTSKTFSRLKELYYLRRYTKAYLLCKKMPISFYILCFNRISTNTPMKDLKQDLLQEIDQAMIDNSSGSLQKEISNTIQDFEISGIPFMIDDRDWKVKK